MYTKEYIINTALTLFSENGYNNTSMQKIAKQCGIAKGSLYTFFSSKEELFIEIFDSSHRTLFNKLEEFSEESNLDNEEYFIQTIELQINYFMENEFIMADLTHRDFPIQNNEKLEEIRNKHHINMMNWHKDCIIATYGEKINPYLWDLIVIFRGFLKQYLYFIIYENQPLSIRGVSVFIVKRLNSIVRDLLESRPEPILNKEILFGSFKPSPETNSIKAMISETLNAISTEIKEIKTTETIQSELEETLNLLTQEIEKETPRTFLINALIGHLEQNNEISGYLKQLKSLLKQYKH